MLNNTSSLITTPYGAPLKTLSAHNDKTRNEMSLHVCILNTLRLFYLSPALKIASNKPSKANENLAISSTEWALTWSYDAHIDYRGIEETWQLSDYAGVWFF